MRALRSDAERCPFSFNFDPTTFEVGDAVSYRVETMEDIPFAGYLLEVHEHHVVISEIDPAQSSRRFRATRESRPRVKRADALD